jgi:hypothetical protein
MILPIVATVLMSVNQEPWFIVTYSANLIRDVLGVSSILPFGPGEHGFNLTAFKPHFGVGIAVMAAYAIIGFVSGMAIAVRKEE